MINIKRFIDKVTSQEGRNGRDVVLTIADARALRDEISKLIIDRYDEATKKESTLNSDVIQVEMKGGKW
jgi:hypothetical protein